MSNEAAAIRAQAHLHHAYFLGLQLMVSTRRGAAVMGDWMFRLFRRQHLEKFLASFAKLGLTGLPDAVACAQYHVLSNNMGGVGVEYIPEHDRKAWVRFRYPRWMYHGPTLCGVTVEVSRGYLNGWYAHNGASLGNPRLAFVCVSEDMTGEFGLCGYFREFDHPLADDRRLQFAQGEIPPPFDPALQPHPPVDQWDAVRLEKANRNYALEYVRNGLCELANVIGTADARELGSLAARLIGLQYFAETAAMVDAIDGDLGDATTYLARMFQGMGDAVTSDDAAARPVLREHGLRVVRGLPLHERDLVLDCWIELWRGALASQRQIKTLDVHKADHSLIWRPAVLERPAHG
jgi:hypothetical protein